MKKLNLAVLISGSGRTLQNFIDLIGQGKLPANIQVVISSKPDVQGLERAKKHNIPAFVVDRKKYKTKEEFSQAINDILKKYPIDLITLAGFLHLYVIPPEYHRKVLNIHPALLPDFGGDGFYGDKVHQAVLNAGRKESGCTVHFADNTYDTGPIIVQKRVPVLANDTVHTLADRVFEAEKQAYPEAIRIFAEGKLVAKQ
ncbi:MAG: phosphoribosylglycinamide formyltransferase [Planctomycetes bacterium]|nr:phosphoribosylglycinamide formyltransferase [Planctomycetota bacterium]